MRALILSILVSFTTTACITGDNIDESPGEDLEAQTDDVIDTEDLPPLTHEPVQGFGDRLDALDELLDLTLVRDKRWPHPTKGSEGPND